jgi:nitrogen fixation protein NifU and related proteins
MSELRELYQQVILDHNKSPRNFGTLPNANRDSEGHNPLCGDRLHVFIALEDDIIRQISFEGSGCAISRASASLMTAALKGRTVAEAERLFGDFHQMLTAAADAPIDRDKLGKLAAFAGVREFPMRVKCATLPWHTAKAALSGQGTQIATE